MKKVVIAGSASLQGKVQYWKKFWKDEGYVVTGYPNLISEETFLKEYPKVHTDFFRSITEADILFVMNEDKNGIAGYLGAESFAEMCFGVAQKMVYDKDIEIIILRPPENKVQSYNEINLWLKLDWIKIFNKDLSNNIDLK